MGFTKYAIINPIITGSITPSSFLRKAKIPGKRYIRKKNTTQAAITKNAVRPM